MGIDQRGVKSEKVGGTSALCSGNMRKNPGAKAPGNSAGKGKGCGRTALTALSYYKWVI